MSACVQPPPGHLSPCGQTKLASSTESTMFAVVENPTGTSVNFAVRLSVSVAPDPSGSVSSGTVRPLGTPEIASPSATRTSTTSGSSVKSSTVGSFGLLPLSLARASAESLAWLDTIAADAGICTLKRNSRGVEPVGFTEPRLQVITFGAGAAAGAEQPDGSGVSAVIRRWPGVGFVVSRVNVRITFVAVAVPGFATSTRYVTTLFCVTNVVPGGCTWFVSRQSLLPALKPGGHGAAAWADPAVPATAATVAVRAIESRVKRERRGSIPCLPGARDMAPRSSP